MERAPASRTRSSADRLDGAWTVVSMSDGATEGKLLDFMVVR